MASADDNHLIKEGDKAVLKRGDIIHVVDVIKKKKYQMGKTWLHLDGALGEPYGSCFEAKGAKLSRVSMDDDGDTQISSEGVKDNRNLFDSNENQKLSRDEIESMKKEGVSRKDIVDQLVENSATFKEKTEFAQQKYIKKKKTKYQNKVTVLKPTIRHIAEMYFKKGPTKIGCLRIDSLSQILAQANVQANSRMLLVDGCNGLVLAALMEKMAGFGTIIDFYEQDSMVRPAVGHFNFGEDVHKMVRQFPLSRVAELKCWARKREQHGNSKMETDSSNNSSVMASQTDAEGSTKMVTSVAVVESKHEDEPLAKKRKLDEEDVGEKDAEEKPSETPELTSADLREQRKEAQAKRREKRLAEIEETKLLLDQGGFHGLIVAARHQPAPLVLSLIELISPSRPVVVFCAQLEPLEDCYMRLRDRGGVVAMKVSETWQRNYQILPNRTHPEILMSNCSGYLLTATTTTCDR